MAISIEPYGVEHESAVRLFNQRIKARGAEIMFSEKHKPVWLPAGPGERLYEEFFVAADGGEVRGAYALKHQDFAVAGAIRETGFVYSPVSEGLVEPRFAKVGALLIVNALRRRPLLYCLGMGSLKMPLPRLLLGLRWTLYPVPFYFYVARGGGFLRNLSYVDCIPGGRFARKIAAAIGVGALAAEANKALRSRRPRNGTIDWLLVDRFGEESDRIWEQAQGSFSLIGVRDSHSLNRLYEQPREKFIRILVRRDNAVVGWAVALDTHNNSHKQFGDARLGSLVDCLAVPGCEHDVVVAATRLLEGRGVDLIVTNQAHSAWRHAATNSGWLPGPSNYFFAASPQFAEALAPFETSAATFHITRGDGEGPSHL